MADFADFDRYCVEHNIAPGEEPAAFAAFLNERTGWDGPMIEHPVVEPGQVVLWVGGFTSKCGVCLQDADPAEKTHLTVPGFVAGVQGCGRTFTHIAPSMVFHGIDETLRTMRPDLAILPSGI